MDQSLTQFRNALLDASSIPTSTSNINVGGGNDAVIGNLQNMYRGTFQAGASSAALGAAGGAAGAVADQQKADKQRQLQDEQDALDAAKKAKEDALDPSKYRMEAKDDGGYDFYDPEGNAIDIKKYSSATGQHITDVLKKSQNPDDQEFITNYKNVQSLIGAMQSGNQDEVNKLFKKDPSVKGDYDLLKKQLGRDPSDRDVVKAFRSGYGKFFNTEQQVQLPASNMVSQANENNMSLLDRLKSVFAR